LRSTRIRDPGHKPPLHHDDVTGRLSFLPTRKHS
jgi:hypothetical protein